MVVGSSPVAVTYGKYKPELNEYFHMYLCQLNFALFCATSALGISWQHLNHPNLLVRSVYRFHVYFHVRLILNDLGIPLPHEDLKKIPTRQPYAMDHHTV